MKQSKYDTDQDGICDAPECTFDALTVTDDDDAIKTLETMAASMEKVGLKMNIKTLNYNAVVQKCATMAASPGVLPGRMGQGLRQRVHVLRPAARRWGERLQLRVPGHDRSRPGEERLHGAG